MPKRSIIWNNALSNPQLLRTCSEPDLSKLFRTEAPENISFFLGPLPPAAEDSNEDEEDEDIQAALLAQYESIVVSAEGEEGEGEPITEEEESTERNQGN